MGTAIKKSGIPREEIFVVTKVSVRWLRLHIGGGMGGRGAVPPPPQGFYIALPLLSYKTNGSPPSPPTCTVNLLPPPMLHTLVLTYFRVNCMYCNLVK